MIISYYTHIDAGLLAHRLNPLRCGTFFFFRGLWLCGCGGPWVDVTHHQVYVFFTVQGLVRLAALLQGVLGLAAAVEQVRQVVLLDGDDSLEVTSGRQVGWVGLDGGEGAVILFILAAFVVGERPSLRTLRLIWCL